jgi:hypothetical protein
MIGLTALFSLAAMAPAQNLSTSSADIPTQSPMQ